VAIVELVVLEDHDVRYKEGLLQVGIVDVAALYTAQGKIALLELGKEVRGDETGRWETTGNSGKVKLVAEYATVEVRVVGRVKEIMKATACEHEGEKGARRRGRRVVVRERKDEDVFHCVLKEE
jgi:hypothetical protein